jgi:hypothetical protein
LPNTIIRSYHLATLQFPWDRTSTPYYSLQDHCLWNWRG